jgi:hypothetical protein
MHRGEGTGWICIPDVLLLAFILRLFNMSMRLLEVLPCHR